MKQHKHTQSLNADKPQIVSGSIALQHHFVVHDLQCKSRFFFMQMQTLTPSCKIRNTVGQKSIFSVDTSSFLLRIAFTFVSSTSFAARQIQPTPPPRPLSLLFCSVSSINLVPQQHGKVGYALVHFKTHFTFCVDANNKGC